MHKKSNRPIVKMKTSDILKAAKKNLRCTGRIDGKIPWICISIKYAIGYYSRAVPQPQLYPKEKKLLELIQSRLFPGNTLELWLQVNHGIQISQSIEYRNQIQATRHAWVDSLIEEFESKGD